MPALWAVRVFTSWPDSFPQELRGRAFIPVRAPARPGRRGSREARRGRARRLRQSGLDRLRIPPALGHATGRNVRRARLDATMRVNKLPSVDAQPPKRWTTSPTRTACGSSVSSSSDVWTSRPIRSSVGVVSASVAPHRSADVSSRLYRLRPQQSRRFEPLPQVRVAAGSPTVLQMPVHQHSVGPAMFPVWGLVIGTLRGRDGDPVGGVDGDRRAFGECAR